MMSPDPDDYQFDVPPITTVERLVDWYKDQACSAEGMTIGLEVQGLATAADANRKRARAYRLTVQALEALRERCCQPETEFRGHLQTKTRPKAQVRAPP